MADSFLDRYEFVRDKYGRSTIGHGSFGIVEKVQRKADKKILACKILSSGLTKEKARQECRILSNLGRYKHPHIVEYVEAAELDFEEANGMRKFQIALLMEYCESGNLEDFVAGTSKHRYVDEAFVLSVFTQMADALAFCHFGIKGPGQAPVDHWDTILHRDVKPSNILMTRPSSPGSSGRHPFTFKLCDFGLGRVCSTPHGPSTYAGTQGYKPPEISSFFDQIEWTTKSDIYSLGASIYRVCSKTFPSMEDYKFRIFRENTFFSDHLYLFSLPQLADLIRLCLQKTPEARPESTNILRDIAELIQKTGSRMELSKPYIDWLSRRFGLDKKIAADKGHSIKASSIHHPSSPPSAELSFQCPYKLRNWAATSFTAGCNRKLNACSNVSLLRHLKYYHRRGPRCRQCDFILTLDTETSQEISQSLTNTLLPAVCQCQRNKTGRLDVVIDGKANVDDAYALYMEGSYAEIFNTLFDGAEISSKADPLLYTTVEERQEYLNDPERDIRPICIIKQQELEPEVPECKVTERAKNYSFLNPPPDFHAAFMSESSASESEDSEIDDFQFEQMQMQRKNINDPEELDWADLFDY